jgi:hypothetical protein
VFKDDDVLEALLVKGISLINKSDSIYKDFIGIQAVPQRELVLILESQEAFASLATSTHGLHCLQPHLKCPSAKTELSGTLLFLGLTLC